MLVARGGGYRQVVIVGQQLKVFFYLAYLDTKTKKHKILK